MARRCGLARVANGTIFDGINGPRTLRRLRALARRDAKAPKRFSPQPCALLKPRKAEIFQGTPPNSKASCRDKKIEPPCENNNGPLPSGRNFFPASRFCTRRCRIDSGRPLIALRVQGLSVAPGQSAEARNSTNINRLVARRLMSALAGALFLADRHHLGRMITEFLALQPKLCERHATSQQYAP